MMAFSFIVSAPLYATPTIIPLQVGFDDPFTEQGEPHRGPILVPEVSIDSYTLLFMTPCDGCLLSIVNEDDEVVYSTIIPFGADTLVLPSSLSGSYELQIIRGNYVFYGGITL